MRLPKFILLLTLFGCCGCSILGNLDEITILGQYSREKDTQHALVEGIDAHYDALVRVIDQGHIKNYKDQDSFLHSFGDPILKKDLGNGQERWLYRYAIYRFAKDKVYVYFDRSGKMIRWEKLACPKLF